ELSATGGLQTITGPAAGLTIDAGGQSRVFQVDQGVTASLSGLTLTGGHAIFGGAVVNYGNLTLTDSTVSDSSAAGLGGGGGIFNQGSLTLGRVTLTGNQAGFGGAIFTKGTALKLTDCTVTSNTGFSAGGGIEAWGPITVLASTFSANKAQLDQGGAID